MSVTENKSNTYENILELENIKSFTLQNRVRSNPDIVNFIRAMLDLSKKNKIKNSDVIDIFSTKNQKHSKNIINMLKETGYEFIKFTPSMYKLGHMDHMPSGITSHRVIGQEFDNVVVVLNNEFFYKKKILNARSHPNPDYLYVKLFYQSATRAREKLAIIIENNEGLLEKIIELLQH